MEDRCVCCGEIIPEGRMVCPLCQEKPNERLKVGDTIKCATSKEMVDLMMLLAKEGIDTDFLYDYFNLSETGIVEYSYGQYELKVKTTDGKETYSNLINKLSEAPFEIEKLGNIFDNAELLEVD